MKLVDWCSSVATEAAIKNSKRALKAAEKIPGTKGRAMEARAYKVYLVHLVEIGDYLKAIDVSGWLRQRSSAVDEDEKAELQYVSDRNLMCLSKAANHYAGISYLKLSEVSQLQTYRID
jgi:hypothetical protein